MPARPDKLQRRCLFGFLAAVEIAVIPIAQHGNTLLKAVFGSRQRPSNGVRRRRDIFLSGLPRQARECLAYLIVVTKA